MPSRSLTRGAVLDIRGEIGEGAVDVDQVDELGDPVAELVVGRVLGDVDQHWPDHIEYVADSRIGMYPVELERVRHRDVAGHERLADRRESVDEAGQLSVARDVAAARVHGGSQIGRHRPVPFGGVEPAMPGDRDEGSPSSGQIAYFEFGGAQRGIDVVIGHRDRGVEHVGEHAPMVVEQMFDHRDAT